MAVGPIPDTIRLHIKNNRGAEDVFRITPDHYREAAERHPDLAGRIDVEIDFDIDNFWPSMATAHGLVTWDLPTSDLAERAPHLRWIHVIGAGVEHLQPLDWLPDGVKLTNNRGVHAEKAGQYGLMALLMLNNAIPRLVTAQHRRDWAECFTTAITGKRLLVVGAGQLGRAVAISARRFGVKTTGIRRTPRRTAGFDAVYGVDALDDLLPETDFLLVAVPATSETNGLIDRDRLARLGSDAGVINMGRASVIDYEALAAALTAGRLGGAVLDVFDAEPLPASSPLWEVPNLIITPHVSSDDALTYTPLTLDLVFENARRLLRGRSLKNVVDPVLGY